MDLCNPVVRLCVEGTRAEFDGRFDDACALYRHAWDVARTDYEACVAAHYVARCQESPEAALYWNQEALRRAEAADNEQVRAFYPSLYANLGRSHERLGDLDEAKRYYRLAADLGLVHQEE